MSTDYNAKLVSYALKTLGVYPLRPIQRWLIDTHFNKVNSTMMNISAFYKLDNSIDLEKAKQAINDTCEAHDIFRCRFVLNEEIGEICQRFDGEFTPVKIEKLSDAEFEERKKNLLQPYKLLNSPLYRIYLFETPSGKYFYCDFYHAVMDGIAIYFMFTNEVEARYRGKKFSRKPLQYADFILEELTFLPEKFVAGNKFWHDIISNFDKEKHLPPADLIGKENWQNDHFMYRFKNISKDYFKESSRKEDSFFLAASMLTISKSADAKSSVMSWIHNGRNNAQELRLMGIMMEQYPISWNFENDLSVENFLNGLEEKMNEGLQYRGSLGTVYSEGLQDDCVTFMFQKAIRNQDSSGTFAGTKLEYLTLPKSKFSASENVLDIELNTLENGDYLVDLDYDASRYSKDAMKKFAETMDRIILQLQNENKFVSEILEGK